MKSFSALLLVIGFAGVLCAQTAPARKPPYDEKADARADIAKAIEQGQQDHKRIILIFGGNW